jgi:uncharacterized protein YbcI
MTQQRDRDGTGAAGAPVMSFGSFPAWPGVGGGRGQLELSSANPVSPVGHGGEINREIRRKVVGCYRQYFGRGPTKAEAFYHGDVVVVVMRRVMTGAERLIVQKGCGNVALEVRQALTGGMRDSLAAGIEEVLGREVTAVMTSTDIDADAASCVFVVDGSVANAPPAE